MQEIPSISAYVTEIITLHEASIDCLATASNAIYGLKMAFLDKNAISRPYFELEAIARQSVEASRESCCA